MEHDKDEECEKGRTGFMQCCFFLTFIAALIAMLGIEVTAFALMKMLFAM